jgi:hypothetical protein
MTKYSDWLAYYAEEYRQAANEPTWRQADIAWQVRRDWGEEALTEFARMTGRNAVNLRRDVRVAEAYPPGQRFGDISFSVHKALADEEDRMHLLANPPADGWTEQKATALMRERRLAAARADVEARVAAGEAKTIGGHVYRPGISAHDRWLAEMQGEK